MFKALTNLNHTLWKSKKEKKFKKMLLKHFLYCISYPDTRVSE